MDVDVFFLNLPMMSSSFVDSTSQSVFCFLSSFLVVCVVSIHLVNGFGVGLGLSI